MKQRSTNAKLLKEVITEIAFDLDIHAGVAKAKLAGHAACSVPSLERMLKGAAPSEASRSRLVIAINQFGFIVTHDQLFPLVTKPKKAT